METIKEFIEKRKNKQQISVMKLKDKLVIVYDFLEKHKHWAYSIEELQGLVEGIPHDAAFERSDIKEILKILNSMDAVSEKNGYYIFNKEVDVLSEYKMQAIKRWEKFRFDPEELKRELREKGLDESIGCAS